MCCSLSFSSFPFREPGETHRTVHGGAASRQIPHGRSIRNRGNFFCTGRGVGGLQKRNEVCLTRNIYMWGVSNENEISI